MKRKLVPLASGCVTSWKQRLFFLVIFQLSILSILYAQNIKVTGVVKDAEGNTIPGVSVNAKGTNIGTTTDSAGHYALNVPANATLVFSSIGYGSSEQHVKGRSSNDVTLKAVTSNLDAVVVVGYGT